MSNHYVTFIDANGVEQRHELERNVAIYLHDPDTSIEAEIQYTDGKLDRISTFRDDYSTDRSIDCKI